MRNYRNSILVSFLVMALCAFGVVFSSAAAQQPVAKASPDKAGPQQKPKPATNEDEPVAITPKSAAVVEEVAPKPAPTLRPDQHGNFRNPATNAKGQVAFLSLHNAPGSATGGTQTICVTQDDGKFKMTREGAKILNLKDEITSITSVAISENGDLTFIANLAGKEPLPENPNAPNRDQYISKPTGLFIRNAEGIKVLLRLGEEVPNMPSFFSGIANASSNSKGQTAFIATYTDPDGKGLFILENGKAKLIVRSGQKIGAGETRVFSEHYYPARINERGEIAWFSRIGSDGGGIFILRDGKVENLAMQGKPSLVKYKDAAGKEQFANFIGFGNRAPALNDNGDVLFAAFFDGPEYGRALFLKPANGPLQLVARDGNAIEGMSVTLSDFNYPAINNKGEIAFLGNYGSRTRGIFVKRKTAIEAVALLEQKLPNGKPDDMLNQFMGPVINDRAEVFFYGQFKNSSTAIFMWDATKGLRTLARRGDQMVEAK